VAAYRGTRQVGFAVVATTLVLISVFVPIAFLQGDLGRLFSEFALTMAAAVAFSSFVALTLSAMLASKVLRAGQNNLPDRMGGPRRARAAQRLCRMLRRHAALALGGLAVFVAADRRRSAGC
jgi:multidrug efflux pump